MFKHTSGSQRNHSVTLLSPANGSLVSLSRVPDRMHAERVLGPGVAVDPEDGLFVAPVDGVVRTSPRTPHAYTILAEGALDGQDVEVLLQVGVDSYRLEGLGLTPLVRDGQRVSTGQPLCRADLDILRTGASSTLSPVVITRGPEGMALDLGTAHGTAGSTPLARLTTR